jgi:hypothetical protein
MVPINFGESYPRFVKYNSDIEINTSEDIIIKAKFVANTMNQLDHLILQLYLMMFRN